VSHLAQPIVRFHAIGAWPPDQVHTDRVPTTWGSSPDIDEIIDRTWRDATGRLGVFLFDGTMCRLETWDATPQQLRLALSETTYKRFLGTNLTNPRLADRYGPQVLANPVGVSPALLTADNHLMMGRRNASVAYYPNRIHPFAGALDPDDPDVFAAVRRELKEELGFDENDVSEILCTGIAEDLSIRQPELIFLVRSTRSREGIERRLDATEHDDSWSIPAKPQALDSLFASLRSAAQADFTPVAIASLLLFGRISFGEDFFQQAQTDLVAR
jgi:8-oxo-dGTP pyrophosphatase MutT (NUDIX family)